MAKYSESQKRATTKYNAKAYDQILLRVKKGSKEKYQSLADQEGKSMNGLVNDTLDMINESNQLKAILKIYDGLTDIDIIADVENGYLSTNTCRNGREVIWYADESRDIAIYLDTLEELDEEEIETELY